MNKDDKEKELDRVASEIEKTKGGPLQSPGINPVPGEGNPDAEVMFIGEAPGFNENEQRRPFVGQAGKLLRKNLVANRWSEDEVYITNIVKFRPPENRDPTPEEIEFFKPYLDKQIEIIDPKIIVSLGRFSMYKFIGEGVSISRIHGQLRTITWKGKNVLFFPMYHPAAALRSGEMLRAFEEDFKKLREIVDNKGAVKQEPIVEAKEEKKDEGEQLKLV